MEKNGFTITPDNGSNNGTITIVANSTITRRNEVISVQGGNIKKSINIIQNGKINLQFTVQSKDNRDTFRTIVSIVSADNSTETITLVPNIFEVGNVNNRNGESKVKTFTEFGSFTETNNFDCDVVNMRYTILDRSKNVRVNIMFIKLTNDVNNITFLGSNPNPILLIKTLACIIQDSSADRNKRMIVYKKFINTLTSNIINFNPDQPHTLLIIDNIITKTDGDELKSKSISGKINVVVTGHQQ